MSVEKIDINNFLSLANQCIVIDVRSPIEFNHAHFPNAYSLPLFNDEERKIVGTSYKQQSREAAIKIGFDFFGVKMRKIVEEVERLKANNNRDKNLLLLYCWRGGMRSEAMAWLLNIYGFKVCTLKGGYKSFRNQVFDQFNKSYNFKVLGGFTGSGKTEVLRELKRTDYTVIDLEKIASHKGSAFGALGELPQPSQEMFENILALELYTADFSTSSSRKEIWVEDESQRIGNIFIPKNIWEQMRNAKVYFLEVDFEERLNYLIISYGYFEKDKLLNAIERIQKKLGNVETKKAISYLLESNIKDCFRILLNYYDKLYKKALNNRDNFDQLFNKISCDSVSMNNINNLHLIAKQV